MDDFKKTLTIAVYILSMIIVCGMILLDATGFGILQDPALQTVWYINVSLLFLSLFMIGFQAPTWVVKYLTTSHSELEPSQPSEPWGPKIGDSMATEAPSEPQVLEVPRATTIEPRVSELSHDNLIEEASRLEESEALEQESLEQKRLEEREPLERGETLDQKQPLESLERRGNVRTLEPPTREQLKALKKALVLTHGSLQYKRRGDGIYHVVWDKEAKKHEWTHLGSWLELKAKLTG